MDFSNYIVYVDESGDHSLTNINKDFPVFVLAFCIFKKDSYANDTVLKLKKFKFKHFGHDMIVLHENEIRRDKGDFAILNTKERKEAFIFELTKIIEEEEFTIISTVINKQKLINKYNRPKNPYNIALKFCLERLYHFLKSKNEVERITHIIVEQRGEKEDKDLELEFMKVCSGSNFLDIRLPFEIVLSNKKSNSAGLQLADLIARPIGLKIFKEKQENRAFEILKNKFYQNGNKQIEGSGLKIFP
ncbi:DUF3800 domain-containing protein [Campylobacter hyointestinalis]|uniref:DUF3800 domain-containing protein n=1 Tax=Campylobacter hyointestinalis TaxID=198 RepID=UPI000CE3D76F|nr:DUF3800 domain-containing protein [Campylobacter hyointestinalis]PPB74326.1 3-deoxy-D-manno-octulosonic acid transferase [Campylobacter hyointestinalis subsp. hyointestinalis]PPB75244.1 3-deoxy-D-manno-octulosonic acid transferase [Campylobacter hyointestinalis subsp. hyointestinalis]PPB76084.1 3-deoxy-D-manno-octulosonic acid transferase [Campylobacter hyointestinalis subsp. hyointestinalis]PPB77567.1 3-deoxy-D-manno-octulosonic acid transferase [Campylobacter hyointestinalis subsp. hyointe